MIDFCVEIFLWSGATTIIYYHEIYLHKLRKWKITKGISVFAAFTCIAASMPCERNLWAVYSDCMLLVFSSPYLDVPLRLCLHLLICLSDCLS